MKKKEILAIELPAPKGKKRYEAVADIVTIADVKHLLCDLYKDRERIARFVNNKNEEYVKYIYEYSRWSKACEPWNWNLRYGGEYEGSFIDQFKIDADSMKKIEKFGIKNAGKVVSECYVSLINRAMYDIRDKKATERYKAKEKLMNDTLALTPALPDDFDEWIEGHYRNKDILYKRETKYRVRLECCNCGISYTERTNPISPNVKSIPTPEPGLSGTCSWCGNMGAYKQAGRYKTNTLYKKHYLFQNVSDGIVVRHFESCLEQYRTGYEIKKVEIARVFINLNEKSRTYWNTYYGDYYVSYGKEYWRFNNNSGYSSCYLGYGDVYPGYKSVIKDSSLKYNHAEEYQLGAGISEYVKALCVYAYYPDIETLNRQGYMTIVRQLMWGDGSTNYINKRAKNIPDLFKVKSDRVAKIKNAGIQELAIYQYERKKGLKLNDEQLGLISTIYYVNHRFLSELDELQKYLSLGKVLNYIKGYASEYSSITNAYFAYRDYIKIKSELGYDMSNSVYLKPRSLKVAHDAAVAEQKARADETYISEKLKKFSRIPERYKELKKKYSMESNGYMLIPARNAGEIITEGRTLHHCVGSSDIYMGRHDRGEGAIIFMRNIDAPDVPYVTIEINIKDQKICQWYGAHDKKPQEEATLNAIHDFEMLLESLKVKKKKASKVAADN
ncbi:MAG: PcfJ domain-containing protein, partial [Lachnospiraceae bacterium]|nr:PcfJ domain-containing protein [Lachnospiraceae bacterium]